MTLEEEIRQTLGTNIKRFRALNRLSQEELAERIAISANFLSNIEIGRKWISPPDTCQVERGAEDRSV